MMKRFRRHLSPSLVISMIALFAALGGGYAVAFSGSGTLQKGDADLRAGSASFKTVRTLTGVGSISAQCQNDGDDNMTIRFTNTAGEQIIARTFEQSNGDYDTAAVANNGTEDQVVGTGTTETIQWHLFKGAQVDGSKGKQLNILTSAFNNTGNCGNAHIKALALNTQQ